MIKLRKQVTTPLHKPTSVTIINVEKICEFNKNYNKLLQTQNDITTVQNLYLTCTQPLLALFNVKLH